MTTRRNTSTIRIHNTYNGRGHTRRENDGGLGTILEKSQIKKLKHCRENPGDNVSILVLFHVTIHGIVSRESSDFPMLMKVLNTERLFFLLAPVVFELIIGPNLTLNTPQDDLVRKKIMWYLPSLLGKRIFVCTPVKVEVYWWFLKLFMRDRKPVDVTESLFHLLAAGLLSVKKTEWCTVQKAIIW